MSAPCPGAADQPATPSVVQPTLGSILRGWLPTALAGPKWLGGRVLRVLQQIADCGTAKLGLNLLRCRACDAAHWTPRSCGDRHCPRCLAGKSQQWLEKQTQSLVAVTYYHCVFTLPEELNALLLANPRVLYPLLFRSASQTLLEFGRNRLGGDLGITAVLHTWGQKLNYHPHLHCIVTGGALSADGKRWQAPKQRKFLFPVRAVGALFRGKFLAGLKEILAAEHKVPLRLPQVLFGSVRGRQTWWSSLYQKKWVVYSKQPFGGPAQVLSYLANYTHRVAISNRRILEATADHVTFSYRDYRDASKLKSLQLTVAEFVRRFSLHILPLGLVRIRHFGILANNRRQRDIGIVRELLARQPKRRRAVPPPPAPVSKPVTLQKCPACGQETLVWVGFQDKHGVMHYRALPGRACDSP
jgi:hypothetical protein